MRAATGQVVLASALAGALDVPGGRQSILCHSPPLLMFLADERRSILCHSPPLLMSMAWINYGWIGQEAGSGFCDIARPTLGVFASLDRF
jgi:hypothetical protein